MHRQTIVQPGKVSIKGKLVFTPVALFHLPFVLAQQFVILAFFFLRTRKIVEKIL